MQDLRATLLWEAFARKATDKQKVLVAELAEKSANRLDRVIETFPNYTLHNRVHALNVVKRMGDLLGPHLADLTGLEGAFFILSAYLHDIGMVFTEEERQDLASEERFPAFLKANPPAEVRLEQWRTDHPAELNGVPADIAEWYCRWSHAERVHLYLAELEETELLWDGQDIREMVGLVCESHNFDLEQLWNRRFPVDYQGEADLLFSAILLRLADILDFDNSRSPEEVYRYLRLDHARDDREQKSETEWRKHLVSGGFVFPGSRGERYALAFKATPDHPAVEYDIRAFLNVIENELRQSNSLLVHCADKWRKVVLPFGISRENITSNGYKYGEHRFTLEQNQILDLLMGENIYEDPYVFVRELIQNAIDTTRHREFYERTRNPGYNAQSIRLSSWQDRDGYQWMRIDDYGMGMDEGLIVKYLLKVGASYYQSSEFKAELLRYESGGKNFVPISRFGIGLLSCFIAGDQLELSTYRLATGDQTSGPLRLSMQGLRSFFTMHLKSSPYHKPSSMPNRLGKEERYRTAPGTSIAVRLNPARDQSGFDLRMIARKCVLHPPVPIEVEGELIGERRTLIEQPWLPEPVEVPFTAEQTAEVEGVLGLKIIQPLRLRVVPLNLTQYSGTPNLAGQAVLAYVVGLPELLGEGEEEREISIRFEKGAFLMRLSYRNRNKLRLLGGHELQVEERSKALRRNIWRLTEELEQINELAPGFSYYMPEYGDPKFESWASSVEFFIKDQGRLERRGLRAELREAIIEYREFAQQIPAALRKQTLEFRAEKVAFHSNQLSSSEGGNWLSHNGVSVPATTGEYGRISFGIQSPVSGGWFAIQLALLDSLRPDLSLSRDDLRGLSWEIYSNLALTLSRTLRANVRDSPYRLRVFQDNLKKKSAELEAILQIGEIREAWLDEPVIAVSGGSAVSLKQIRARVTQGEEVSLGIPVRISEWFHDAPNFMACCVAALLQTGASVSKQSSSWQLVVNAAEPSPLADGQFAFPPLFFVPYEDGALLRQSHCPINLLHPFAQWLVANAKQIRREHPGLFESLRGNISREEVRELPDKLNAILARLRYIAPGLVPEGLQVKPGDFKQY